MREATPEPITVPAEWTVYPGEALWYRLGYRAAWHEGRVPERGPLTTVGGWARAWRDGAKAGALARRRVESA